MGGERDYPVGPLNLPGSLATIVGARDWARDVVGESGGEVYRLHAAGTPDLYLKHGTGSVADAVVDEMVRLRWIAAHVAAPALRGFVLDGTGAWLLTDAVPGRTAWQIMTDEPGERQAVVRALGGYLAALHAVPLARCPFDSGLAIRTAQAWDRVERDEVDVDDFDDDHAGWTARDVWAEIESLLPVVPDLVVTHGDYSLDNIFVAGGIVTGCIDWGRAGVADRYQDLAILANCLDEFDRDLRGVFFEAYGLASPDEHKLRLYRCLDEMF